MPDRNTPMKGGELVAVPVAAGAVIDGGTLVAVNATGFAVPAAGTSGLTVVGVADERVDNTGGADGAAMCRVRRGKVFLFSNDSTGAVTQALFGKPVFVKDAGTTDIRFSYLQPNEVLIARDLLNKQIVDTRGARVVRVNDLKLSDTSSSQLRLLGAEVGIRGILRSLSPALERIVLHAARALGKPLPERIIAWNYMDLIERDLSNVKLSVSHLNQRKIESNDLYFYFQAGETLLRRHRRD